MLLPIDKGPRVFLREEARKNRSESVYLNLRIDDSLKEAAKELAEEKGVSLSFWIRELMLSELWRRHKMPMPIKKAATDEG